MLQGQGRRRRGCTWPHSWADSIRSSSSRRRGRSSSRSSSAPCWRAAPLRHCGHGSWPGNRRFGGSGGLAAAAAATARGRRGRSRWRQWHRHAGRRERKQCLGRWATLSLPSNTQGLGCPHGAGQGSAGAGAGAAPPWLRRAAPHVSAHAHTRQGEASVPADASAAPAAAACGEQRRPVGALPMQQLASLLQRKLRLPGATPPRLDTGPTWMRRGTWH